MFLIKETVILLYARIVNEYKKQPINSIKKPDCF